MKKSAIFKILTLSLTFVIFSCCSGCLLYLINKKNEERHQHLIEKQKERKAQADALIPEIDGYIFEALPKAAFKNQEDWINNGYFDLSSFLWGNGSLIYEYGITIYNYDIKKQDDCYIVQVRYWDRKLDEDGICEDLKITIEKTVFEDKIDKFINLFNIKQDYTFSGHIGFIKGEYFMTLEMRFLQEISRAGLYGPPALFLLDFENNSMHYVGYAKGWLEYEIANGKFFIKEDVIYKLTKVSE